MVPCEFDAGCTARSRLIKRLTSALWILLLAATLVCCDNTTGFPKREIDFLQMLEHFGDEYSKAVLSNDILANDIFHARATEFCKFSSSGLEVTDWVGYMGHVNEVGASAALGVQIARGERYGGGGTGLYRLVTWNIEALVFSEGSDATLITPSSPLFPLVSKLVYGERVRFSGTFFPGRPKGMLTYGHEAWEGCVLELSMTQFGSMSEPEFLFRFTSIERFPSNRSDR